MQIHNRITDEVMYGSEISDSRVRDLIYHLVKGDLKLILEGKPRKLNLACADLKHADLPGIDLSGVDLSHADLSGACLNGANLQGAIMVGTLMRNTKLVDTNLEQAQLTGALMPGANLHGAVLRRACLHGADLTNAMIQQAVIDKTNLTGVRLLWTDVKGVSIVSDAIIDAGQDMFGHRYLGVRQEDGSSVMVYFGNEGLLLDEAIERFTGGGIRS